MILNDLANGTPHGGKKHIMPLLDYFIEKGPNGEHGCLVFDVMGPNAASMVEYLPENLANNTGRSRRYPLWMAKSILRQVLLGIDFLHESGIVHGDLQAGNILSQFLRKVCILWERWSCGQK